MSKILILAGVIAGGTFIWWLAAGSSLIALVDRLTTVTVDSVTPVQFSYDEGHDATPETPQFYVGDRQRPTSAWHVVQRPIGRLSLDLVGRSFVFGVLTACASRGGDKRYYEFQAESGDVVRLTRRESRFPWPRPFEINWLGGPAARWGRYVYFELVWRKPNGDVLDVVWRDEKRFEKGNGWVEQYNSGEPLTRLMANAR
jgi:hypothetical protein